MRPTKDEVYLQMTDTIATRSTCPRRQVGCIIVDKNGRILSTGYNGVAAGRPHCNEGRACPGAGLSSGTGLDACEAIHAEQNAILLLPDPKLADTIYVSAFPCASCMKLLLGTSAKRIVYRQEYAHPESHAWWAEAGRTAVHLPITRDGDGSLVGVGFTSDQD